jgi:intraflagellar transport protein 172
MFEDAYRVAKSNGGPNSSKQVAYLWARSLGGEGAVKLLTKLALLDSAIDFATENGAFDFAFELSRFADKQKLADVHYRHAMYLEDEGKLKEAEAAFILAGKPREAILMYIHEEKWDIALQVAEKYEPVSVPEVLIGQAKVAFESGDSAKAESLILRAQKPEIVMKMYQDANMWKEALKFTKQYLPNKFNQLQQEYDRFLAGQSDAGKDHLINTAVGFERQKEFSRAIDIYLKLSKNHTTNLDLLEEKWKRAVELTIKFVPDRLKEVGTAVAQKFIEIKKNTQAGDLYVGIELYKDAIDTYIAEGLWDKAKAVLQYAPKYAEYIENSYIKHLKAAGKADTLVNVDASAGLEIYAEQGDWDKCLETASSMSPEVLGKYLSRLCTTFLAQGKAQQAIDVLLKYGTNPSPSHIDMYQRIVLLVLKDPNSTGDQFTNLRNMLYKIVIFELK